MQEIRIPLKLDGVLATPVDEYAQPWQGRQGNATLYGKISLPYNVSVPASPDAGIPTPEMFGSSNAITLGMKTGFSFNKGGGRNYAGADIYSLLDFYENEDTPA